MAEIDREYVVEQKAPTWLAAVAIVGLLLGLGALGWALGLQNHLNADEANLAAANQQNAALSQALSQKLDETNQRMQAQAQTLGESVGLTQKQLEEKSNQLIAEERVTAHQTSKLQQEQAQTAQQVGAVQSDVSNVKTSVASTQADLADTKTKLGSAVGDEGVMSGLIATNHDQLEMLKHRGDRNYYEFTLHKGAPSQHVGTIKVALKKVDPKHSKFTLIVSADDKNIEKKDRTLDEPIQFYSGKSPALFEIVVNNIGKNVVSGYLSTPKDAPKPFMPNGE
jgi:type II secretory pathway pseudopilin PulG